MGFENFPKALIWFLILLAWLGITALICPMLSPKAWSLAANISMILLTTGVVSDYYECILGNSTFLFTRWEIDPLA